MTAMIAITGAGTLSPGGATGEALWRSLADGVDRRTRWPRRPLDRYPVDNVIPIPEADWKNLTRDTDGGGRGRALAEFLVGEALAESGLSPGDGARVGCVLASTTAGTEAVEDMIVLHPISAHGVDGTSLIPRSGRRWTGPTVLLSTACSSGLLAPALAMDMLLADEADAMVAGGLDVLLEYTICGFNALRLASADRCRPFSVGRKGVVLSEGGACFCLERLDVARARGAQVRAVVTGYGISCDAGHVTAPSVSGVARAMRQALEMSRIAPGAIGGVFTHGTGTPTNDGAEVDALRLVFGAADLPPITSIKAALGHSQAGAGAVSMLTAVLALEKSRLPMIAGLVEVDPDLGAIDLVTTAGRSLGKSHLMVNAFGFGGNNCVMILRNGSTIAATAREAA